MTGPPVAAADLPLVRRFPALAALPFAPLGVYPTPVLETPDLARAAGLGALFVKRDDLTGERYGGNKVRRLELSLGQALRERARGVWTLGVFGSHHTLATTVYAAQLGLEAHIHHFAQPLTDAAARNRAVTEAHATTLRMGWRATLPLVVGTRWLRARLAHGPGHLFYIPGGGSSALADVGYVNAALELAEQIQNDQAPRPDVLVVPFGTGGTLAGLVVGLELAGLRVPVLGVRVVDRLVSNARAARRAIARTAHLLHRLGAPLGLPRRPEAFTVAHGQFGAGYARPSPAAERAVASAAGVGLALEPTYTGRALAAVLEDADRLGLCGRTVLFWNTVNSRPLALLDA